MDPIEFEGTEIKSWTPKPAKFNADGDEIEPPKMAFTFLVDMDRCGRFMNRITWMYRKGIDVKLSITGVEQLPLRSVKPEAPSEIEREEVPT
jgi:hypothetical protein